MHDELIARRFWSNVEKSDGCWRWAGGAIKKDGRGYLTVGGKSVLAPRYSWELHNGAIPEGLFVCHSCDNPNCVNPDHLWLGTNQDNMVDAARKGRNPMQKNPQSSFFARPGASRFRARGEAHGSAKLTDESVRNIRAAVSGGRSQRAVAREYSVHPTLVSLIVRKRIWRHV